MNIKKISATMLASSFLLATAGMAQSSTNSSSSTNKSNQQKPAAQEKAWTVSGQSGSMEIRSVKKDKLEDRLTAERLMGKDVVDSRGEKIGEIRDIGLSDKMSAKIKGKAKADGYAATTGMTGAGSAGMRSAGVENSGTTGSAMGTTGTTGSSTTAASRTSPGTTGSMSTAGSAGTTGTTGTMGATAQSGQANRAYGQTGGEMDRMQDGDKSMDLLVFVKVEGSLGLKEEMISVPVSELRWNSEEENFTLDIERNRIKELTERNDRQYSAIN